MQGCCRLACLPVVSVVLVLILVQVGTVACSSSTETLAQRMPGVDVSVNGRGHQTESLLARRPHERPFGVLYREEVQVSSEPAGLAVWVEGEQVGWTPVSVVLDEVWVDGVLRGESLSEELWLMRTRVFEDAVGREFTVATRQRRLEARELSAGNRWFGFKVFEPERLMRVIELRDGEKVVQRWGVTPDDEGSGLGGALREAGWFEPAVREVAALPVRLAGERELQYPEPRTSRLLTTQLADRWAMPEGQAEPVLQPGDPAPQRP